MAISRRFLSTRSPVSRSTRRRRLPCSTAGPGRSAEFCCSGPGRDSSPDRRWNGAAGNRFARDESMTDDESAIRDLIQTWMTATAEDPQSVLSLIDDDAIFLGSAPKPYGKKEFAEKQVALDGARVKGKADVKEVRVDGDW